MKKPYWSGSPLAVEISELIKRRPLLYGCSLDFLEAHCRLVNQK